MTFKREINVYDLSNEFGIGYTNKNKEFYFDLEDYELIKDYCWYISNRGYALTEDVNTGKGMLLHRLVLSKYLNISYSEVGISDHVNKNRRDNQKKNLRICTAQENSRNRGGCKK